MKSVGLPIARGKLVCEFNFHKEGINLPCRLYKRNKYQLFKKAGEIKTSQSQNVLDWQRVQANFTLVNALKSTCTSSRSSKWKHAVGKNTYNDRAKRPPAFLKS